MGNGLRVAFVGFCSLAMQSKPMKQQFCLVIKSVTFQTVPKDAI